LQLQDAIRTANEKAALPSYPFQCSHIYRENNTEADSLAKRAVEFQYGLLMMSEVVAVLQLCLLGCTSLTAEDIVKKVAPGLKQSGLVAFFLVTRGHLEKLKYLFDGGLQWMTLLLKPRFYPNG
jgi:hypothetical protein